MVSRYHAIRSRIEKRNFCQKRGGLAFTPDLAETDRTTVVAQYLLVCGTILEPRVFRVMLSSVLPIDMSSRTPSRVVVELQAISEMPRQ